MFPYIYTQKTLRVRARAKNPDWTAPSCRSLAALFAAVSLQIVAPLREPLCRTSGNVVGWFASSRGPREVRLRASGSLRRPVCSLFGLSPRNVFFARIFATVRGFERRQVFFSSRRSFPAVAASSSSGFSPSPVGSERFYAHAFRRACRRACRLRSFASGIPTSIQWREDLTSATTLPFFFDDEVAAS